MGVGAQGAEQQHDAEEDQQRGPAFGEPVLELRRSLRQSDQDQHGARDQRPPGRAAPAQAIDDVDENKAQPQPYRLQISRQLRDLLQRILL